MSSGSSGGKSKFWASRTAASKQNYKGKIQKINGKDYLVIGDNELPLY